MSEPTAPEAAGAAAYATGCGKPPLHTRFRNGQSGNPAGLAHTFANVVVGFFKIP
jgi:hypothetical protein